MPRPNQNESQTPARSRSRGPARSAPRRAASVDSAADSSTSSGGQQASAAPYSPTYDEIAEAAYHRYLRRGATDGLDFEDWVEAERELKTRQAT